MPGDENLTMVMVPEQHSFLAAQVLQSAFADIQAAHSQKPDGTFLTILIVVDNLAEPRQLVDVAPMYLTVDELRQQGCSGLSDVVEGFRVAQHSGFKAALFVIQDEESSALLVRSIDSLPWPNVLPGVRGRHAS